MRIIAGEGKKQNNESFYELWKIMPVFLYNDFYEINKGAPSRQRGLSRDADRVPHVCVSFPALYPAWITGMAAPGSLKICYKI